MNDHLIGGSTFLLHKLCKSHPNLTKRVVTAFPLTPILIKTASFESCKNMSERKRKILSLEEHVKVVDRLAKVESARAISIRLSVGKTHISRCLPKRKTKSGKRKRFFSSSDFLACNNYDLYRLHAVMTCLEWSSLHTAVMICILCIFMFDQLKHFTCYWQQITCADETEMVKPLMRDHPSFKTESLRFCGRS